MNGRLPSNVFGLTPLQRKPGGIRYTLSRRAAKLWPRFLGCGNQREENRQDKEERGSFHEGQN